MTVDWLETLEIQYYVKKKLLKILFLWFEASSYQLDYSQLFTSKYSAILNISPDHIERHRNLKNYISAKFSY
jgi:UDP-N-acetylmuramoylalanine--D-glutamate ligase